MIKKIVLYFLLLFTVYNLMLFFAPSIKLIPQSNYDFNVIKGQTFFKKRTQYNSVVVGSSLGNRIDSNIFPEDFYFLTFSGLGSADGLEINSRSPTFPKTVFIEINSLGRVVNKNFISDVLNFAFIYFHKMLFSFQKLNKPSSLLHKPIGYLVYGTRNQFIKNEVDSVKKINSTSMDATEFVSNQKTESITTKIKNESFAAGAHYNFIKNQMRKKLPTNTIQNAIKNISKYVDYLENNGVKIVFYRMPIVKDLNSLERPIQIRQAFFKTFPPDQYEYITVNKGFEVISNDGIHLIGSSIPEFSILFKNKALSLIE